VNDAGNIPQDCQEDVDEEVTVASTFHKHTDRWYEDGENDLDDVAEDYRLVKDR
jgi:hypothetical protein